MDTKTDWKRVAIFCAFAFGIAWAFALLLALTGGLVNSPVLVPGTAVTLAFIILPTGYMMAPALAHVLTRLVTREGWGGLGLRFNLKHEWRYWVLAWLGPAVMTIVGAVVYFALFPQYFDGTMSMIRTALEGNALTAGIDPWIYAVQQTVMAVLISPLLNGIFTFGEEFGWRGYLQPRLKALGERRMFLLMGLIWGLWHAPVILMGHNYGLDYPGAPWAGVLMMIGFTVVTGTFIGWVSLRAGSVWPAVIAHGALNGIANLAILFIKGSPNPLLGPLPVGLVASAGFTAVAVWILAAGVKPREPVNQ